MALLYSRNEMPTLGSTSKGFPVCLLEEMSHLRFRGIVATTGGDTAHFFVSI